MIFLLSTLALPCILCYFAELMTSSPLSIGKLKRCNFWKMMALYEDIYCITLTLCFLSSLWSGRVNNKFIIISGSSVFPEVITDHLEATTANINQLKVNQPIQTQRGDVAYHFKLKDHPKSIQLEEGDIIGFFENSSGKSEIRRLTCENVRHAKLAGVISRSAWLEGKTPSEDEKGIVMSSYGMHLLM